MKLIACFLLAALAVCPQQPALPPQQAQSPQRQQPAAPPPTKPEDLCAIEGQVFSLATGAPVPKAEVILRGTQRVPNSAGMPQSYSTVADAGGNFTLKDLEPGKYRLSIRRTGFVNFNYGSHRTSGAGTLLSLDPGRRMKNLTAKLTPHAVITGRVVDDNNEPIVSARVEVMRYTYQSGKKQLTPSGSGSTNDLGEYRIYGLAPGRYYLVARPGGDIDENSVDRSAVPRAEDDVPTYYPGTIDAAAAAPIEVGPGMQLRGVNVALSKARTFHVRGRVEGHTGANVMFAPRGEAPWSYPNSQHMTGPKGTFEINQVLSGAYTVSAMAWTGQKAYSALQDVDIGESNIDGLILTLAPGSDISGHFEVEGTAPPNLDAVQVYLRPNSQTGMVFPSQSLPSHDGLFTISVGVEPYSLQVTGAPDGYWVKSIRMGDQEVKYTGIDLGHSPAAPITITLAPNAAQIDGVILNEQQEPAAGATVVLVPEAKLRDHPEAYRTGSSDQNGRFTLKNIEPGDYTLFAWEDVEYGAYMDPAFLKPVEDRGQSISLQEGGHESVQVNMIPADAAAKSQKD